MKEEKHLFEIKFVQVVSSAIILLVIFYALKNVSTIFLCEIKRRILFLNVKNQFFYFK